MLKIFVSMLVLASEIFLFEKPSGLLKEIDLRLNAPQTDAAAALKVELDL